MLEEAIPALLSAVHGWFTPAVLFVVLNIVIGTIAVTSKATAASAPGGGEEEEAAAAAGAGGAGWEPHRRLARVPSMAFERLRSFNGRFAAAAAAPEPAEAGVVDVDLGYMQPPPAAEPEKEGPVVVVERRAAEPEPEPEHAAAAHMERSRSEAAAAEELPRLPARLLKSASDRSAFAHLGAEEVEEAVRAVESRRPATTRETRGRRLPVAVEPEPASESSDSDSESGEEDEGARGGEVDARADDFINRFRHELKLQRIESFIRHRETVRRGQAAAGGV